MRVSKLFTKTTKDAPANEMAKNAQLLIQAGYVYKVMAGVYAYTNLGLKVVEKIKQVVREEMNAVEGQELLMSGLQKRETWEVTDRWDDEKVDVWFKSKLKDGTDVGFGWSHEEAIVEMMKQHVKSYKDLPVSVYQFQTKMRNELRAKSGIMRGREFVMKDMYSMHASQQDMDDYYDRIIEAYKNVFMRLGLGEETFVTFASGGAFTKYSHEFQTLCDAGEDVLYVNKDKTLAVNEEVLGEFLTENDVKIEDMHKTKTAETGNIFKFGTEKSEKMNFKYVDENGKEQYVYLASYGIGVTRVMGVMVELLSDDSGLVWTEGVAPYKVHLVSIGKIGKEKAEKVYKDLQSRGIDVLYDDRDERAGKKFADADLMGMPYRVTISDKLVEKEQYELKNRQTGKQKILTYDDLLGTLDQ